ncbi:MAG TPA: 4-hydroxy-tetrahydrodipicolinate reductase [Rhizomicrobium sp.]|jgi:4-hydroxy-tetrahydrodipicolinate reductase
MSIKIVVAGAAGRMGQSLIRAIAANKDFTLTAALERSRHPDLNADAGVMAGLPALGVMLTGDPLPAIAAAQALVDFTAPAFSVELAALSAQARIVHVMGTTGFSREDEAKIHAASRHAAIIKSGNMSLGVTLLAALAKQAAKALPDFDIEIVEMHHRMKVDAPSGTALLLGNAAAEGRGTTLDKETSRGGARKQGAIGFASLRGGTVVGEHEVVFAGVHERIALRHIAEDRSIFAQGALAAAKWGQGQKPGLYAMNDVLGL